MLDTQDTILAVILGIILVSFWFTRSKSKKLNLPPGLPTLPIIGSVIQVALADHEAPFIALQKLAKQYGSVMSGKLGAVRAVAISGYQAIKEIQMHPDFVNRLDDKWLLDKTEGIPCESAQIGGGIFVLFPKLLYYFPNWSGYNRHKKVQIAMEKYMEAVVARYRNQGTYKTRPGNFVETFLQLIDEHGGQRTTERTLETPYSDLNLVGVLNDLGLAGSDTTANSANFAVRYLVQNPETQTKLYQEIYQVLGNDRWVTLDDKPRLKYTQAFILESLRLSSVVPIVFPRKTYKDCQFRNYDIPKGTLILINLWSANLNEDVWENPHVFNPERFLDADGNLVNAEKTLSFGIGRRNCIGELLAKSSLLMILVSLVQQFSFEPDPMTGVPADLDSNKLSRNTLPFKVLFKLRH